MTDDLLAEEDHLMFEKATTPGIEAYQLLGEFDAHKWAQEFKRLYPESDEELMLAWFANAIMAGYDKAKAEDQAIPGPIEESHHEGPGQRPIIEGEV